jgi:competence protein ComEC
MVHIAQKGKHLTRMLRRAWPAVLMCVSLATVLTKSALPSSDVTLDVLDIGQGDAILVQDGSLQMLVDGGPDGAVLGALGDSMPIFDRTIEFLVLTHPHADHYAGLIAVLQRYRVLHVIRAERAGAGKEYERFEAALAAEDAQIFNVGAGDEFSLSERARLHILWPPPNNPERHAALTEKDENISSVVMRLETPGGSALLTGDATADVEKALLNSRANLKADILKVAHHGSPYSSTQEFLENVRPKFAAISVGTKNGYDHPGWAVIRRLETMSAQIFRTDHDGAVRFRFSPEGIAVSLEK